MSVFFIVCLIPIERLFANIGYFYILLWPFIIRLMEDAVNKKRLMLVLLTHKSRFFIS